MENAYDYVYAITPKEREKFGCACACDWFEKQVPEGTAEQIRRRKKLSSR